MTVKEFIQLLSNMPEDARIVIYTDERIDDGIDFIESEAPAHMKHLNMTKVWDELGDKVLELEGKDIVLIPS